MSFKQTTTMVDRESQTMSLAPLTTVYEYEAEPKKEKEVITYSKAVQASLDWSPPKDRGVGGSDTERDESPSRTPRANKRLSRRQKERDEEIRAMLKKEIEDEIKAAQQASPDDVAAQSGGKENFPFKTLSNEELAAVESSEDFIGFVERSTKVLERALDQQLGYDILADYSLGGLNMDEEDEGYGSSGAKKGRRIKEIAQFWDERWSKKRMISDIGFSTKVCAVLFGCGCRQESQIDTFTVPGTRLSFIHQESLRAPRPRWPCPSLESPHARSP
jgi:dynein intermediate chain